MDPVRFHKLTCGVLEINHGTLDDINLAQSCPLDHGKHRANASTDLSGLGELGILCFEILCMIFTRLDIPSLFVCRRLSRRVMYIIDSSLEYRDIIHFVPNAFRGALSIESSHSITCRDLHMAIFDGKCVGNVLYYDGHTITTPCDNPAFFVCVLTGRRWCLSHVSLLARDDHHLPLLRSEVEDIFGFPEQEFAEIPSFKSLPGQYSPDLHPCNNRLYFLDGPSVRARAAILHGSYEALGAYQRRWVLEGLLSKRLLLPMKYNHMQHMPDYVVQNCARQYRPPPLSWNVGRLRLRRFMTVVRSPQLDYRKRVPHWGRYCVACQEQDFSCWLTYTVETLEEHLVEHERSPGKFSIEKVPLEYSDARRRVLLLNSKWPRTERLLVCKWDKLRGCSKEHWTHDDILARWNGRKFI